ncbi:MAG TPA: mobile mystery protein B [Rhodothermales bacterium]|nr:mobile mystery protein B [Rhodothermales bacterium]
MPNQADGATPLTEEKREDLIPDHLTARGQLNAWEQANIVRAEDWAFSRSSLVVTTVEGLRELHLRMFSDTWHWAGQFRRSDKNIGVPKEMIWQNLAMVCDDVRFWLDENTFGVREAAARYHHRIVQVHPFPNGNGRHARLAADVLLARHREPRFDWLGGESLDQIESARARYIDALQAADSGHYGPLMVYLSVG